MNKIDLIDQVAEKSGHTRGVVRSVLEAVVSAATEALGRGDAVRLFGLGKLYLSRRGSKPARNIHTNEAVVVPPRSVVLFKASKALVRSSNEA